MHQIRGFAKYMEAVKGLVALSCNKTLSQEFVIQLEKRQKVYEETEVKALWEKLRHSLRDVLRRQQKNFKSGAPVEAIKEWKFQKQMGFLQTYMAKKKTFEKTIEMKTLPKILKNM
ncbi:unnamed protein product [Psylliodes chrysocephalus]|uniref:Uncharacterized protein n=1 Tax=Psylliodes chrysocephalus TaxID=3402493 RepID=A0A9P0D6V3_9CUCU|nr:unnamed protein product [Psylliodes chrysocephala]